MLYDIAWARLHNTELLDGGCLHNMPIESIESRRWIKVARCEFGMQRN